MHFPEACCEKYFDSFLTSAVFFFFLFLFFCFFFRDIYHDPNYFYVPVKDHLNKQEQFVIGSS